MKSSRIACHVTMLLVIFGAVAAIICGAKVRADDKTPQRVPVTNMETKIIPGCVLNIQVDDEDEVSRTYTVDAKGAVHFAISDSAGVHKEEWEVVLHGKNVAEAKAILTESLTNYFKSPEVHVTIVRIPGLHVEIAGEVVKPGVFVLPFNSRISDLFSLAVTKQNADLTNILVRRRDNQAQAPDAVKSFNVDFTSGNASDESDDPKLEDGDKIYLRKMAEVHVAPELQIVRIVGEINTTLQDPGKGEVQRDDGVALPISKEMTIKDVLERIGGLKDTADRTHLYLGRMDGTTRVLNADKVEGSDPEENLKVKPGDLIIVPKRDRSQVFAVLGEVNTPNTFVYRSGEKIRVMQAIARAGDFSKKADKHRAVLSKGYLLDPTRARAIPFDPELVKKGEQPNMEIEAGDALFIEQRKKRPTIWQQLLPLALHFLPF
jgi:protein involved in polysaccharide export with SLBB domain